MSVEGPYRVESNEVLGTPNDALEGCRNRYAPQGYRAFKLVESDDGWRITATTPGGRAGRNLAYVDPTYDPADGSY